MLYLYVYLSTFFQGLQDEEGQGMAEYGLILAGVAVVVAVAVFTLGEKIFDLLDGIEFDGA